MDMEKKTEGRQSIPMEKIENPEDRYTTFSKRRSGLYKKASNLIEECGVDIGIALFSPGGNPFSFFHPTPNTFLDHVEKPNIELSESRKLVAAYTRNKVNQMNNRIDEIETIEEVAKSKMHLLEQLNKTRQMESIEQFKADDITKYEAWLKGAVFCLENHLKQIENGALSSSQAPLNNADNTPSTSN